MALQNGALGGALLFPAAGVSGARLRFGTAHRWAKIRNEVHDLHGWWPEVTSAGDGYRELARQVVLFKRNYTTTNTGVSGPRFWDGSLWWRRTSSTPPAAVPGTSNHGLGTTVDVVNLGTLNQFNPTTTRYKQFAAVAARHGFSNAEGRSIGEPWHWSDTLNPDDALDGSTPTTPTTEADMPLDQTDKEAVDRIVVDRVNQILNQRELDGNLTQLDKESIDKLIIDRVAAALGPLSQAAGEIEAMLRNLAVGGSPAAVNYEALAKAVNDDAARRLAQ